MPRTLQHITTQGRAEDAGKNGEKVETLCGVRVYQMPNMKDEIPTCSPCARELMKRHADAITAPRVTYTYNVTTSGIWTAGGAA